MNGGTAPGLGFSIEIDATSAVAFDADRVEALITVAASSTGIAVSAAQTAEVLIMDRSRSMMGQNKIHEARRAACAAIEMLPDGTLLGIIGGNSRAERVFPSAGGLVPVGTAMRTAAKREVMSLWPEGGTRIGRWLAAANELFATGPAAGVIRHAVLYSDGKNEHETREELDDALRACADRFVCDVRGLGDDWNYAELLHIAEALGGDARAVIEVADLTDDFTDLMRRANRLVVPRAYLRLSPDPRFRVESISQTHPVQAELAHPQRQQGDKIVIDVPLGPWEQETRCYQLTLRFQPDSLPVADDVRITPVELLAETTDGTLERRADAALVVRRHEMGGGATLRPERLTQVAKIRELTFAIKGCVDAWDEGRGADADDELDQAIALATELGDVRLRMLNSVATRRADGKARLRPDVTRGDMLRLGMDSVKTGVPTAHAAPPPQADTRICHKCGETTYGADLKCCENCGTAFNGNAAS